MSRFVRRSEKVAFMETDDGNFKRMKNFTTLEEEKNPIEYGRHYIDESYERVDVVGISVGVSFALDERLEDEVHGKIIEIFEKEQLGDSAQITIVQVNFSKPVLIPSGDLTTKRAYEAKKRTFSVIPESEGGEMEVYSYEGSLRAQGPSISGVAKFTSNVPYELQESCTFVTELTGDDGGLNGSGIEDIDMDSEMGL